MVIKKLILGLFAACLLFTSLDALALTIKEKYADNIVVNLDPRKGTLDDQGPNKYPVDNLSAGGVWSRGKFGRLLDMPNLGCYDYGDNGVISGSSGVTIFARVKMTDLVGNSLIVSRATGATIRGYGMFLIGPNVRFRVTTTSTGAAGQADLNTTTSPSKGQWMTVIASYSDTDDTMRIAINGVEIKSSSVLASGTMLDASTLLNIGATAGSAFDGYFSELMVLNVGLTTAESLQLYQETLTEAFITKPDIRRLKKPDETSYDAYIADGIGWNESLANSTAGIIENTGWNIESGTWKIVTTSENKKYLECVVSGVIGTPSSVAYGTWEFDWYKEAGDYNSILFISSQISDLSGAWQTTYELNSRTNDDFTFLEFLNGSLVGTKMAAAAGTTPVDQWFRVRLTRTAAGIFTLYLSTDGGTTFTAVTATSGSNPFTDTSITTSSFFVLIGTTGSKFKNFKFIEEGY